MAPLTLSDMLTCFIISQVDCVVAGHARGLAQGTHFSLQCAYPHHNEIQGATHGVGQVAVL